MRHLPSLTLLFPPAQRRLCWAAAVLSLLAALSWPVLALAAMAPMDPALLLQRAGITAATSAPWGSPQFASWQQAATLAVLMLPALTSSAALLCLARGFRALARGRLQRAHWALSRFALWTLASVAISVLAGTAAGVLLTWNLGPGLRQLSFGLSSSHLHGLLTAALVWAFAHVLLRTRELSEENAQFV